MKYFVRVENFMQMQFGKDDFMGFFTTVNYFDSPDCEEKDKFIRILLNSSLINLEHHSWQHNNCYLGTIPIGIITEGIVCINCYREDKKRLILYDLARHSLAEKELDSKDILDFYKM